MTPAVQGNLEALAQAAFLAESLTDESYCHACQPYLSSSIGQHMRHLLDNYFALMDGVENQRVDYNHRRRGAVVEQCRQTALKELHQIERWFRSLTPISLETPLTIYSEVSLEKECSDMASSTLHREMIFVASHSIHHLALMGTAARLQHIELPKHFGLAPATATWVRKQESSCAP